MSEISVPDGTWSFDLDALRVVPGSGGNIHVLRRTLGEIVIPLTAIAGVTFEPARKGGHLRVRLRPGADALTDVVAGGLGAPADPYRLAVPKERTGVAEYVAAEIRDTLTIAGTPSGPCAGPLLPPPPVPVSAAAGDGEASFDGQRVRLEWTLFAKTGKQSAGPQEFPLSAIAGVEWKAQSGAGYGALRFRVRGAPAPRKAEEDPHCLTWGVQRWGGATALVAAAVHARLSPPEQLTPPPTVAPDPLVRRLTELGELHRAGVLTDEEFTDAKRALLARITELS